MQIGHRGFIVNFLLDIFTAALFLVGLVIAAIMDIRTRKVQDWVWLFGLIATPMTGLRLFVSGLFFLYVFQVLITFGFMILFFNLRIIGGADGKAILVLAISYPWLITDVVTLLIAPYLVLVVAFLLTGIHCIILTIQNIFNWRRYKASKQDRPTPKRRRFWFSRKLSYSPDSDEVPVWKIQLVPLILYYLIAYLLLLIPQLVELI